MGLRGRARAARLGPSVDLLLRGCGHNLGEEGASAAHGDPVAAIEDLAVGGLGSDLLYLAGQ